MSEFKNYLKSFIHILYATMEIKIPFFVDLEGNVYDLHCPKTNKYKG